MENYDDVKPLGCGSYGDVALVRHKESGCLYVCKTISLRSTHHKSEAENEVIALAKLSHPCIIGFVEAFIQADAFHIIMEYADAADLEGSMEDRRRGGRRYYTEDEVMRVFIQVALGLREIHKQHLLHRDLKAANVFLNRFGDVKMGDFGFAKQLTCMTALASTVCGTPFYFSPELFQRLPYNTKSDVWGLGVILYEIINLRKPFEGCSLTDLRRQVVSADPVPFESPNASEDLKRLSAWLLNKSSLARPSVDAVLGTPFVQRHLRAFAAYLGQRTKSHDAVMATIVAKYPPPRAEDDRSAPTSGAALCGGGRRPVVAITAEQPPATLGPGHRGHAQLAMQRKVLDPAAVAKLLRQGRACSEGRGGGATAATSPQEPLGPCVSDAELLAPTMRYRGDARDEAVLLHRKDHPSVRPLVGGDCPLVEVAVLAEANMLGDNCRTLRHIIETELLQPAPHPGSASRSTESALSSESSRAAAHSLIEEAESEEERLLHRELGDMFVRCIELALCVGDGSHVGGQAALSELVSLLGDKGHLAASVLRVAAFFEVQ